MSRRYYCGCFKTDLGAYNDTRVRFKEELEVLMLEIDYRADRADLYVDVPYEHSAQVAVYCYGRQLRYARHACRKGFSFSDLAARGNM
jgi:hypothetical protein